LKLLSEQIYQLYETYITFFTIMHYKGSYLKSTSYGYQPITMHTIPTAYKSK